MPTCVVADEKNFFVGRVKRNLFAAVVRRRDLHRRQSRRREQSAQTYGADVRLATSRFLGRPAQLRRQRLRRAERERRRTRGDDWSYGFSAAYPNDKFDAQVAFRDIQRELPAGARLRPARQRRGCCASARSYNPRPKTSSTSSRCSTTSTTRASPASTTTRSRAGTSTSTPLDWHFKSGDSLHGVIDCQPDLRAALRAVRDLRRACCSCPGEYRFTRFRIQRCDRRQAPRSRAASASARATTGRARRSR